MSENNKPSKLLPCLLVLVPAVLLLSAAGAVWWYWHSSMREDPHPGLALGATELDDDELRDSLRKLTEYIGPRDWETPEGRTSMRQAIALVSGTLSPRNYGYVVKTGGELVLAGERWPTVWVDAPGSGDGVVLVAVPYDGDHVSMAALLALAGELRDAELRRTVRFAFYPAGLWTGLDGSNASILESADSVLCVNRLGAGRDLWLVGEAPEDGIRSEILDGHAEELKSPQEARHFARSSRRIWEIRGRPDASETGEAAVTVDNRAVDDLRARLGRLAKILRDLANSE